MTEFRPPRPLAVGDVTSEFDCGEPSLNRWLKGHARGNEASGASRTFVSVTSDSAHVAGYYCLSASALVRSEAPGALARNMPDPIPVVLLGRLAVDSRFAGIGLGSSLLQHAVARAVAVADTIGMRAIIVHALDESAASFYARFGFTPFPGGAARTLYLLTRDALATAAVLGARRG